MGVTASGEAIHSGGIKPDLAYISQIWLSVSHIWLRNSYLAYLAYEHRNLAFPFFHLVIQLVIWLEKTIWLLKDKIWRR